LGNAFGIFIFQSGPVPLGLTCSNSSEQFQKSLCFMKILASLDHHTDLAELCLKIVHRKPGPEENFYEEHFCTHCLVNFFGSSGQ
jgi:hypothetical protein